LQRPNVAALERSDNAANRGHAFAELKRGYETVSDRTGAFQNGIASWRGASARAGLLRDIGRGLKLRATRDIEPLPRTKFAPCNFCPAAES